MLGRIIKFRRGDQYEEMQGRDTAGKSTTADAASAVRAPPTSTAQTNRQLGDSTAAAARDATPDGASSGFYLLFILIHTYYCY